MSSTASAPCPRATKSCTGSTTKSLHSTGMSTASATSERSVKRAAEDSGLGQHADRRRAAVLVVQRLLGRLAVRRDRARRSATPSSPRRSRRRRCGSRARRRSRAAAARSTRGARGRRPTARRTRRGCARAGAPITFVEEVACHDAAPSRAAAAEALADRDERVERRERAAGVDATRARARRPRRGRRPCRRRAARRPRS